MWFLRKDNAAISGQGIGLHGAKDQSFWWCHSTHESIDVLCNFYVILVYFVSLFLLASYVTFRINKGYNLKAQPHGWQRLYDPWVAKPICTLFCKQTFCKQTDRCIPVGCLPDSLGSSAFPRKVQSECKGSFNGILMHIDAYCINGCCFLWCANNPIETIWEGWNLWVRDS
jgi:hypothetical protein